MERGSKRKAASVASPAQESTRPAKRQKTPDLDSSDASITVNETAETTAVTGLHFIEQLKKASDKNGRLIATPFLTLPDPSELPEYYEATPLPIAIDTIEEKLNDRQYPNMNALDSDVKRMVANAKQFNESKSEIYSDAERVRKMTFNSMARYNPAYRKTGPQPQPTPVPAESERKPALKLALKKSTTNGTKPQDSQTSSQLEPHSAQASRSISAAPTGAGNEKADEDMEDAQEVDGFESMSFQDAQEKLIREFIDYEDPESGLAIYTPFVNLPPRTLTDYYAFIQHPTSLRSVLRKVRGARTKGDKASDGTTEFKSWDSFLQEIGKIWDNARVYNEDDSEIFILAAEFEDAFKKRLAEAKKVVKEPPQPASIKLNMTSKPQAPLKLRLGSHKGSPAPDNKSASPVVGQGSKDSVNVDQHALQRQKAHVQAGINGRQKANGTPSAAASNQASATGATNLPTDTLKPGQKVRSPAINEAQPSKTGITPGTQTSMPPPSSHSSQGTNQQATSSQGPSQQFMQYYAPPIGFESKWRHKGRDVLLPHLRISTHPDLRVDKPTSLNIPADEELAQQHVTVTVPNTHNFFEFVPELSSFLKPQYPGGPPQRQHKLFVSANGVRIPPRQPQFQPHRSNIMMNGALGMSGAGHPNVNGGYGNGSGATGVNKMSDGNPVYDIKLMPGAVNRVEVEIVSTASPGRIETMEAAGASGSSAIGGKGRELEMEKCFVYVHILKH